MNRLARSLLATAFDEHERRSVSETFDRRNTASVAVLRTVATSYEGRLRETMLFRNGTARLGDVLDPQTEWRAI